jgi:hypothetical protein
MEFTVDLLVLVFITVFFRVCILWEKVITLNTKLNFFKLHQNAHQVLGGGDGAVTMDINQNWENLTIRQVWNWPAHISGGGEEEEDAYRQVIKHDNNWVETIPTWW